MKEPLTSSVVRSLTCINPVGKYKIGNTYQVYIQYLFSTKAIAIWLDGWKGDLQYKTFESPSELLQYFDCEPTLKQRLINIEEYGVTVNRELV